MSGGKVVGRFIEKEREREREGERTQKRNWTKWKVTN